MLNVFMLSFITLNVSMLSVISLNVFMLSVITLNVVMLSVVAPFLQTCYSASIPFQAQPIRPVRILCWVMTTPQHHESRAQRYKTFCDRNKLVRTFQLNLKLADKAKSLP